MPRSINTQQHKQKPKIKIHYFYIRGACQPVRNLLYYLQIPFEDIMHQRTPQNDCDVGFDMGLPMLEDGDVKIHQAIAIMNYLCRKYERMDLLGLSPQSFARIQQVMFKYALQRKRMITIIFQILSSIGQEIDKQAYVQQNLIKLTKQCRFFDFCLKNYAKGFDYVMENISLIDFVFYEQCFYIVGFFGLFLNKNNLFKFFKQFKSKFQTLPFFKKYKKQIESKYLFHQFGKSQINKLIVQNWQGSRQFVIKYTTQKS